MKKLFLLFLAIIIPMIVTHSADALGLVRVTITGTNVNVRDAAGPSGAVVGRVSTPSVYIAQDLPVVNKSDGSEWYRLLFVVDKAGNLKDIREVIQKNVLPYVSVKFAQLLPLESGDAEKVQELQGKTPNIKPVKPVADKPAEPKSVTVGTAHEFLSALDSDTTIIMKEGEYDLSEWDPLAENPSGKITDKFGDIDKRKLVKLNKGVSWEDVFDGGELTLKGIKNLTIRGDAGGAEIVIDPRYAFVLNFSGASAITIENVTAGHSEGGYCQGGVFGFEKSSKISISDTAMYGSGTEGLLLNSVDSMRVSGSSIYECTYDIMTVNSSKNISFERCVFRDNKEFSLVNIKSTNGVSFNNCRFTGNKGLMFSVSANSRSVNVTKTTFSGNSLEEPVERSSNVAFKNCNFDD
jgi:hypothetical protein